MFSPNRLKQRLRAGEGLIGAWLETGSATCAELMGLQGFDFLILDLEHGQGDLMDAVDILRAVAGTPTPCIVRVPWNDAVVLKRILDAGAQSIMIPSVENEAEATAAVRACRYPPQGRRGYGSPLVRASGYGTMSDYASRANDELLLVIQIESNDAVAHAEAICAVDGVDVPFLGINDMAGSIDHLEQLGTEPVRSLVTQAEAAFRKSGKPFGTVPSPGVSPAALFEAGYRLVPVASDVGLLRDGAASVVDAQRKSLGLPAAPGRSQNPGRPNY